MSWFKIPSKHLGLAWTLAFLSCVLVNTAWAGDIEIDLGATPTVETPSNKVSGVVLPTKTDQSGTKPELSSSKSFINKIDVSPNPLGILVSINGNIKTEPILVKVSKRRLLLKFPDTALLIKPFLKFNDKYVETIRSAAHARNAWVVLDMNGVQGWTSHKTLSGYDLILKALNVSPILVESSTSASPTTNISNSPPTTSGGLFARLIEASFKPLDKGVKLVLTSDQPAEYTFSKLSQPDRLVLRFRSTKLDMDEKTQTFSGSDMEFVKGGLMSMQLRQIGPHFSPISEVILTLVPGTLNEINKDLNQVVITLTAPTVVTAPPHPQANINQLVSMNIQSADLEAVLQTLASEANFNVVFESPATQTVTENFDKVPLKIALSNLLAPSAFDYQVEGNTIFVGTIALLKSSKLTMPKVTVIIHPPGGMTPQELDALVRGVLDPNNTSVSAFDTVRNVLALHGTVADVEEYKKTMDDLQLGSDTMSDRITKVVRLNYSDPNVVAGLLTPYLTPVGKVQADPRTDSVLIWDTASNMGTLLELVKELDIKSPEVLIEGDIVEVDNLDALNLGLDWDMTSNTNTQPSVNGSFSNPLQNASVNPASLAFGTVQGGVNIDATINALQTHQEGKIISRPRVATVSGVAAEIDSIENVIYTTTTQTLVSGGVATNTTTYNTLPLPVDLKITPRITDDGRITTVVDATVTSETGPPSGPGAPPPTSTQTATTTITIKNGQTIVIGGLVRDTLQDTYNGIPLLMNLPLIGDLFQQKSLSDTKVQLVIFITPTIMPD